MKNMPLLIYCLVSGLYCLVSIFSDISIVSNYQMYFIIPKILFSAISFSILSIHLLTKKDPEKLAIIQTINMIFYTLHGQLFNPLYFLSFVEIIIIHFLSFKFTKKFLVSTLFIGNIVMIAFLHMDNPNISELFNPLYFSKFKLDSIFAMFFFSIICFFNYIFIQKHQQEKNQLYEKFIDLGKNSSSIIHDFKGLLQHPLFSVSELEYIVRDVSDPKVKKELEEKIKDLKTEIKTISAYSKETTNLSLPTNLNDQSNEYFDISEVESSIRILFNKDLNNDLKINLHNGTINYNKNKIKKILYNIIQNSIEHLKENKIKNPEINISASNGSLTISDNGKGFPEEILKNLNSQKNNFITTKENGSGLGISVIKDILIKDSIKFSFFNKQGANIKINFKPKEQS